MFADGTQTALLTYQACSGLPETGQQQGGEREEEEDRGGVKCLLV